MTRILAIAGTVLVCACSAPAAPNVNQQPPRLSTSDAERLMLRADDVKLSSPGQAGLADVFRGRALQVLGAQARSLERQGLRVEERNTARALVFWDPRGGEAVLQVIGQRRIVSSDDPNPAWASTVRQWWARLQFVDGSWWVVDQQDLTPDSWRAVQNDRP